MSPKFEAILFDLDGTLAYSTDTLKQTFSDFLQSCGILGGADSFESFNGPSLKEIVGALRTIHGLPGDEAALYAKYQDMLLRNYREKVLPAAGAQDLLDWLAPKISLAVVTSAPGKLVDCFLDQHHMRHYFKTIVTGDMIERSKPAPDIYRLAVSKLDIKSAAAIAIEDSASGVSSAVAAGIATIGLGHASHRLQELGAVACAETFVALKGILRSYLE